MTRAGRIVSALLVTTTFSGFAACRSAAPSAPPQAPASPPSAEKPLSNAIRWSRDSAEHKAIFLQVYRGTQDDELKEAALDAMLIADDDEGVLTLFQESQDPNEKRRLLETLVNMDSDAVWDLIDATLEDDGA